MRIWAPAIDTQADAAGDATLMALFTLFLRAAWEVWRERLTMPVSMTLRIEVVPPKGDVKPRDRAVKYLLEIGE